MKNVGFVLILLMLAVGLYYMLPAPGSGVGDAGADQAVYVCRETGAIVVGPPQRTPAPNPETGRNTLMPGLYCDECRKWYPAPPPQAVTGSQVGLVCPRHKRAMVPDGPLSGQDG